MAKNDLDIINDLMKSLNDIFNTALLTGKNGLIGGIGLAITTKFGIPAEENELKLFVIGKMIETSENAIPNADFSLINLIMGLLGILFFIVSLKSIKKSIEQNEELIIGVFSYVLGLLIGFSLIISV